MLMIFDVHKTPVKLSELDGKQSLVAHDGE